MKKIIIGLWLVVGSWLLLTTNNLLLTNNSYAQFTTDRDTLLFLSGDSLSVYVNGNDTSRVYDLGGDLFVGVNFDTASAWTSDHFIMLTSSIYNAAADSNTSADPDDIGNWSVVYYNGTIFSVDPITYDGITTFDAYFLQEQLYGFKRYIMFKSIDSSNGTDTEDAPRKLVPLIRSGF